MSESTMPSSCPCCGGKGDPRHAANHRRSCFIGSIADDLEAAVTRCGGSVPTATCLTLAEVAREREEQDEKWGEQNHGAAWWYVILGEEFGEVGRALLEARVARRQGRTEDATDHKRQARAELVQLAAVAVAMVECFDRHLPPGEKP